MSQMLTISASPHLHTSRSVSKCMWHVIVALLPAVACSLYYFGLGAMVVIASSILGCVIVEYAINRWMLRAPSTIGNGSAILTGLLLALNLPSNIPVWIVLIGSVVAIGIGKMSFGGLGCNIWNPALVGRVFLLISFPAQMTSWPVPLENQWRYLDATTGATTLGMLKLGEISPESVDLWHSAMGLTAGSLGEVSALALLLGFAWLLVTRVITWHIPVAIFASVALLALAVGDNVGVQLLSGGLMLGAIFMATDYVTSPMSRKGMIIYGVMIGAITVVIRKWGAYPEGVSFAILLMNSFVPLIDRYIKPRKFGERRARK
ncbi:MULTISPECIES: RnfABCDGE type electron transport complex subunit D [Muribaculum]|uniref:RnfABCDGE type electron transport complex subunit D n=3 Tax=Muribaculaceae TaxID=2005473 RepID=UPI001094063C|nr:MULTISPECIES: RnfABCDGE type electron transport complex subunit D [Muribaculum]TGY03350.1 RnfABCDGE type electron transport complex subunit D [Muribaculum sp. NM65_B17]THG42753.1 RnfABCDGE type electron transport complex subunit D [Muribaculaceae bacterium]